MSLSTQVSVLAKRRANNWIAGFGGAFSNLLALSFWSWCSQFLGNIDMQTVEFSQPNTEDVLLAGAGNLYALWLTKPTATLSVFKLTDNATTASTNGSQQLSISLNAIGECFIAFSKGFALANGATIITNTSATGSSSSTTDAPSGVAIFG
jgi:hypothetical protein